MSENVLFQTSEELLSSLINSQPFVVFEILHNA
jgi:hypothetical protein